MTARRLEEGSTSINRMVVESDYVRGEFAREFGFLIVAKPTSD
jgi:hypothetical protein